jgi:cell division protein FtsI/penicillin-binding protein 2
LLAVSFLFVYARLYYLQIVKGPELGRKATIQRQQNNLLVHRGAITDRHGLPLAIDTTRYDVYLHPDLLKASPEECAQEMAKITHCDYEKLHKLLLAGYPVVTVARHLERETVEELQSLNWAGLDIVPRPFRHYPEGHLASHLLGYVNVDTRGQGGIEQQEEASLKDTGTLSKPQVDGHGRTIPLPRLVRNWDITPPLGQHIELTIDNYLQHLAEKELIAMARHSHASRGAVIIEEPSSGEILAWANYPAYDPNEYSKYAFEVTKNWSMVDVYQPGSTFKILTLASALDLKTIKPDSVFHDGGTLRVGNRTVHNHDGGHGTIDLLHLLIHSSNVGAAQVAMTMTPQQFHDKLKQFGVGSPTGIDLPGESSGLLLASKYWRPIDQATTGFGQGAMAVTPLQLVAAVGTIANDGVWVQPHVIRRIYDPRSGVTEKWTEPTKHEVVSPATAQLISHLLAENILEGSQVAGKVPGYRVAGKTGTAQKSIQGGRGYLAGQTVASFIGFLPVDHPQLLCLAVIDRPQTDGRWGNTIAGPVFNAVAVDAARYLGIAPAPGSQLKDGKVAAKQTHIELPPSIKYAKELGAQPKTPPG